MGGGGGGGDGWVISIHRFRYDVINLSSIQGAWQGNMVGQEAMIYVTFTGINDKPCIGFLSSLHMINNLGHFNIIIFSLVLQKTVP